MLVGRAELLDRAKALGITGRWNMRVGELRAAIEAAEAKKETPPPPPKEEDDGKKEEKEAPPVETPAKKEWLEVAWAWVCAKLGWRNPVALILVTWFEVLLYGYFKNGMMALLPEEMAGKFAILLSLMSWAYVSGAIGNHRPVLRWSTYGLLVLFRVYFEFVTVYGVMNSGAIQGEANARAMSAWSSLVAEARNVKGNRAAVAGALEDADRRMNKEHASGIGERYKEAEKQRSAAASDLARFDSMWETIEPLLVTPQGTPVEVYNRALELYAACPEKQCTKPERADYIDTAHEVSFLLPIEALASGNKTAMATLAIVLGMSTLAFATALIVEIPENKREE